MIWWYDDDDDDESAAGTVRRVQQPWTSCHRFFVFFVRLSRTAVCSCDAARFHAAVSSIYLRNSFTTKVCCLFICCNAMLLTDAKLRPSCRVCRLVGDNVCDMMTSQVNNVCDWSRRCRANERCRSCRVQLQMSLNGISCKIYTPPFLKQLFQRQIVLQCHHHQWNEIPKCSRQQPINLCSS